MERADIESIDIKGNNTSIVRTEASRQEHKDREEYKQMGGINNTGGDPLNGGVPPNRLA